MAIKYRKEYEQYLGYKLTSDIHVHHIDQNRNNNAVSNLVALQKDVHAKFHWHDRINTEYEIAIKKEKSFAKKIHDYSDSYIQQNIEKFFYIIGYYEPKFYHLIKCSDVRDAAKRRAYNEIKGFRDRYIENKEKLKSLIRDIIKIKKQQDKRANNNTKISSQI